MEAGNSSYAAKKYFESKDKTNYDQSIFQQ